MQKVIVSLIAAALVPFLAARAEEAAKPAPAKPALVSKTFKVGADCKILSADKAITLADLKVGDKVGIHYKKDGDTLVAAHIRVFAPPPADAPKPEAKKGGPRRGEVGKDGRPEGERAHGAITAVDAQAGTITVEVMKPRAEKKHQN